MKECLLCSEPLESGEFCDNTCERIYHERNSGKKIVGGLMECECCGQKIVRTANNKKFCLEKCEPKPGGTYECVCCSEVKPLTDFYDYRGEFDNGKRWSKCKECHKELQTEINKKIPRVKPYEKECVVCGGTFLGMRRTNTCGERCKAIRQCQNIMDNYYRLHEGERVSKESVDG